MASWLSSIESLVRAVTLLSWMGIGFAVLAAVCGAAALYLNRQASSRWADRLEKEIATATAGLADDQQDQIDEVNQQLEETRKLLLASEERSEGFLDRIEDLQQQLTAARRSARPAPPPARSQPPAPKVEPTPAASTAAAPQGALSPQQIETFRKAMAGKPAGEITLVTVVGQPASEQLGEELRVLLTELGWKVSLLQGVFPSPPEDLSFVVHSRESIPDTASALSVALAMSGLMSLPSKVTINPARPAGFLGLIVAPPQ